jgi:hypothetical protein
MLASLGDSAKKIEIPGWRREANTEIEIRRPDALCRSEGESANSDAPASPQFRGKRSVFPGAKQAWFFAWLK